MKIIDLKAAPQGESNVTSEAPAAPSWNHSSDTPMEVLGHKSYHELADFPVVEIDALAQLQANLALLEDLQGRLSFVMREVRYLMKV